MNSCLKQYHYFYISQTTNLATKQTLLITYLQHKVHIYIHRQIFFYTH